MKKYNDEEIITIVEFGIDYGYHIDNDMMKRYIDIMERRHGKRVLFESKDKND